MPGLECTLQLVGRTKLLLHGWPISNFSPENIVEPTLLINILAGWSKLASFGQTYNKEKFDQTILTVVTLINFIINS